MSDAVPVPVGQILILRAEFEKTSRNTHQPSGVMLRARLLVRLLDELVERRVKEGGR